MDSMTKDKFRSYVKGKAAPEPESDMEDMDEESSTYDLACELCEALGVSEDKADKVAEVLSKLK